MPSKGREKPSLVTYSRQTISQGEHEKFYSEILSANPRACAILGGAMVDHGLVVLIASKLRQLSKAEFNNLFFDSRAILSTTSARIDLAYAMNLIDPPDRRMLHGIRRIRNTFAHAMRPIDFDHPLIIKECHHIHPFRFSIDDDVAAMNQHQRRYMGGCIDVFTQFHGAARKAETYKQVILFLSEQGNEQSSP